MAFILLESKRDDLLLPYLNILKEKGIEKPLGVFKKEMLTKLSGQASLPNVSLGSNFYLVGAVRYYLNGDLTTDGKAAYMESGDPMSRDNWDVETCKKLNAVINILRNAHIDSVGTEFEQPEDFGTLPIAKLFRKYGKKIEKEIGNDESAEEVKNRIGNGYTFKIIYTFNQAKNYCALTAPGSWCITRQPNWFRDYINSFNIHYIFFLKDGYQSLNRKDFPGPGYTKQKPHDEYGNSMIAMLQRNDSWEPKIITSRWNHGDTSDGTEGTEADRAYTLDEFCQITGVTEEDLQRIYQMWQNNEGKVEDKTESKKLLLGVTRKIKYAQILINGGEKPINALNSVGITKAKTIWGKEDNESKAVIECSLDGYTFLMDRGKILFDTIDTEQDMELLSDYLGSGENIQSCKNAVAIERSNHTLIYNIRYHEFVDIDGVTKFKRLPQNYTYESAAFIEVKNGKAVTALLSTGDLRPLKLPNGRSWFMYLRCDGHWGETDTTTIDVSPIRTRFNCVLELWVGKTKSIFYNIKTKSFFDPESLVTEEEKANLFSDYRNYNMRTTKVVLNQFCSNGSIFGLSPGFLHNNTIANSSFYNKYDYVVLFDSDCNRIDIGGKTILKNVTAISNFMLSIVSEQQPANRYRDQSYYYDLNFKKFVGVNGKPLPFYRSWRSTCQPIGDYCPLSDVINGYDSKEEVIYNCKTGRLLENPVGWPSNIFFNRPLLFNLNDETDLDSIPEGYESVNGLKEILKNPEPFAIIPIDKFDAQEYRRQYWDAHPDLWWNDIDRATSAERNKHLKAVPLRAFKELPNGEPQENNGLEINESVIRKMVKAAINEVIRRSNDIKRV